MMKENKWVNKLKLSHKLSIIEAKIEKNVDTAKNASEGKQ